MTRANRWPTGRDIDRSGSTTGEADEEKLLEGLDEPILEANNFPGGGADSTPADPRPSRLDDAMALNEGRTDAEGDPGCSAGTAEGG